MNFLYFKSLHIIFMVTWFSGLFYVVRLFIYYAEAASKEAPIRDTLRFQYKLMSKRLWYIIAWPSAILTCIFGFLMLYQNSKLLMQDWMLVKLAFVFALMIYHLACHRIFLQQQKDLLKVNAFKLRLWNEVATILLVSIVFIVVLKDALHWLWGVAGIIVFTITMLIFVKVYKKIRAKNSWDKDEGLELEDSEEAP